MAETLGYDNVENLVEMLNTNEVVLKCLESKEFEATKSKDCKEQHCSTSSGSCPEKVPVSTAEISADKSNNTDGKDTPPNLISIKMQTGERSTDLALEQNVCKEASSQPLQTQGGINAAEKSPSSPVTVNDDEIKVDMKANKKKFEKEIIPGQMYLHRSNESSTEANLPRITSVIMKSKSCVDVQGNSTIVISAIENTRCNKDLEPKKVNIQMEEKSAASEGNVSLFDKSKCEKEGLVLKDSHRASFTAAVIGRMRETAKKIFLDQVASDKEKNDKEGPNSTSQNCSLKNNERDELVLVNKKESIVNPKSVVPYFNGTTVKAGKSQSFINGSNAEENEKIVKTVRKNCGREDNDLIEAAIVTTEADGIKRLLIESKADRKSEEPQLPGSNPSSSGCNFSLNPQTANDTDVSGVDGGDKESTRIKNDRNLECKNITEGKSSGGLTVMNLLPPVLVSKPENADCCTTTDAILDKSNEEKVHMNNEIKDGYSVEKRRNENEIVKEQEAMEIASSLFLENTEGDGNSVITDGLYADDDDERKENGGKSVNDARGKSVNGDEPNNSSKLLSDADINSNEKTNNEKNTTDGMSSKLTAAERIIKKFNLEVRKDCYKAVIDTKNQKSGRQLPAERITKTGNDDGVKKKSQDSFLESLLERKRSKLSIESIDKSNSDTGEAIRKKTSVSSTKSTGVHGNLSSSNVRIKGVGMKGIGTEVMEQNTSHSRRKEPSKNGAVSKKATTMKIYVKIMCAEKGSYVKQTEQGPVEVVDKSVQIITVRERPIPCRDGSASTRNSNPINKRTNQSKSVLTTRERNIRRLKELVKAQEKAVKEIKSDTETNEGITQNTKKIVDTVVIDDEDNGNDDEEIEIIDDPVTSKIVSSSINSLTRTARDVNIENKSKATKNVATLTLQPKIRGTEVNITSNTDIIVSRTGPEGSKQGNTYMTTQGPRLTVSNRHLTCTVAYSTQDVLNNVGLPQVTSTRSIMEGIVAPKLPLSSDVVNLSVPTASVTNKLDTFPRIVGVCSLAKPKSKTEGSANGNQHAGSHNNAEKGNNTTIIIASRPMAEQMKSVETLSKVTSHRENAQSGSHPNDEIDLGKRLSEDMKNDVLALSLGSGCDVTSQNITRKVIVSGAEYVWLPKSTAAAAAAAAALTIAATTTAPATTTTTTAPTTLTTNSQQKQYAEDNTLLPVTTASNIVATNSEKNNPTLLNGTRNIHSQQDNILPIQQTSSMPLKDPSTVPPGKSMNVPFGQGVPVPLQQDSSLYQTNQMLQSNALQKHQDGHVVNQQITTPSLPQPGRVPMQQAFENTGNPRVILVQDRGGKYALVPVAKNSNIPGSFVVRVNRNRPNAAQSTAQDRASQSWASQFPPQLNLLQRPPTLSYNRPFLPLAYKDIMPPLGMIPYAPTRMPELTRVHSPAIVKRMPQLIAAKTVTESAHTASVGYSTPSVTSEERQSRSLSNNFKSNTHKFGLTETIDKMVNCLSSSFDTKMINTESTTNVIANSKSQPKLKNISTRPTSEVASNVVSSVKTTDNQLNRGTEKSLRMTTKALGSVATSSSQEQQLPGACESIQLDNRTLSAARTVVTKEAYDTSPFWLKQASKLRLPDESRYKIESSVLRKLSKGLIYDRLLTTGQKNSEYPKQNDVSVVKQIMDNYPLKSTSTDFEIKLGVIENQFALINGNRPGRSFLPNFQDQQFIQNVGLECVVEGLKGYETILKDVAYSNKKDQWKATDYKEALQRGIMGISMKRRLKEVMNRNIVPRDVKVPKLMETEEKVQNMHLTCTEEKQVPLDRRSEMEGPKDINKNEKQIISNINLVEKGGTVGKNRINIIAKEENIGLTRETKTEMSHAKIDAKKECIHIKKQSEPSKCSAKPKLTIVKNSDEDSNVNRESSQKKNRHELNRKRALSIGDTGYDLSVKKMKRVNGFNIRELFVGVEDILL